MDTKQLLKWVDQPETHQKIVGEYDGSYALGVTSDPPAFLLRVEPKDISLFPRNVNLHGVDVPVVVHGGFERPMPLRTKRRI